MCLKMGPSKRKGLVRRQVLDLNSKEDSPQRSTWQTKYQSVLADEEVCQNGDLESLSTVSNNPLSGLLGNYNSDSDNEEPGQKVAESLDAKVEDFLKEIQSISTETITQDKTDSSVNHKSQDGGLYLPSLSGWQQCYDHNSGYPYYWNTETNEVTWEMPAELKAAIESAQKQEQQKSQLQQHIQTESNLKKKIFNYPWKTDSNSGSEQNELVTSHKEEKEPKDSEKIKTYGPVPKVSTKQNAHFKGKHIKLAPEDSEALNEFTYETSSLLAHGVQDTGPPGDEGFQTVVHTKVFVAKKEEPKSGILSSESCLPKTEVSLKPDILKCANEQTVCEAEIEKIAVNVTVEKHKENSPNCVDEDSQVQTEHSGKTTGIALIANYGDDSEPEENSNNEKQEVKSKPLKQLFPIEIPEMKVKPLFPCLGAEMPKSKVKSKEPLQEESESVSNLYNSEFEDPSVQKAFKRKKRIEFATIAYGPSTSKPIDKSQDHPFATPTTQYNMDPDGTEHHGFGFNAPKAEAESDRKTYKNFGRIQFIKAETINLKEPKEKETELDEGNTHKSASEGANEEEEIENAATLLKEKVTFLTAGTDSISGIQQMAIELETLVVAWKDGALTPPYLLRWLKEKCSEITRHEKSAAPAGWTCFWDRKRKRYSYRNVTTKEIQWEYPTAEEKTKGKDAEVDGAGDEMDICDTPPHLSPAGGSEKQTDDTPRTPPPPVISTVSEVVSSPIFTPQPPSPPKISFYEEDILKKKKKRKSEEGSKSSEDEAISTPTPTASNSEPNENKAPPLPPMPPPPEESPPPLPDSPPPPVLPVEPDQPLPPGVDEPEYSFFRTPKHSFKKTQPETAAFSAELMMTYGYGLPVQQVVSSNGQPITMQMQSLEYHTYVQDANSYVVQPGLTSHVIHCPAKKPKPSLTSELVSFYTDLAQMDNAGESSGPNIQTKSTAPAAVQDRAPSPPAPVVPVITPTTAPKSTFIKSSIISSSTSTKAIEGAPSNGVNVKKKKKTKTASGLSLKKKGVSSLVAKWQQVQQEVRRDFSDDDDDDVTPK